MRCLYILVALYLGAYLVGFLTRSDLALKFAGGAGAFVYAASINFLCQKYSKAKTLALYFLGFVISMQISTFSWPAMNRWNHGLFILNLAMMIVLIEINKDIQVG